MAYNRRWIIVKRKYIVSGITVTVIYMWVLLANHFQNEADHRMSINSKTDGNMLLYAKMREIGSDNFYIELLEEYPCKNTEQLRAKEGEYIRKLSALNKRIERRTTEEWKRQ